MGNNAAHDHDADSSNECKGCHAWEVLLTNAVVCFGDVLNLILVSLQSCLLPVEIEWSTSRRLVEMIKLEHRTNKTFEQGLRKCLLCQLSLERVQMLLTIRDTLLMFRNPAGKHKDLVVTPYMTDCGRHSTPFKQFVTPASRGPYELSWSSQHAVISFFVAFIDAVNLDDT